MERGRPPGGDGENAHEPGQGQCSTFRDPQGREAAGNRAWDRLGTAPWGGTGMRCRRRRFPRFEGILRAQESHGRAEVIRRSIAPAGRRRAPDDEGPVSSEREREAVHGSVVSRSGRFFGFAGGASR